MGNNKDLYRNQKKRVISFCNFAFTLTVVKMIYKPEKNFFFTVINCCILRLVEGHHLNVCS